MTQFHFEGHSLLGFKISEICTIGQIHSQSTSQGHLKVKDISHSCIATVDISKSICAKFQISSFTPSYQKRKLIEDPTSWGLLSLPLISGNRWSWQNWKLAASKHWIWMNYFLRDNQRFADAIFAVLIFPPLWQGSDTLTTPLPLPSPPPPPPSRTLPVQTHVVPVSAKSAGSWYTHTGCPYNDESR